MTWFRCMGCGNVLAATFCADCYLAWLKWTVKR